jgi:hypothetical protein
LLTLILLAVLFCTVQRDGKAASAAEEPTRIGSSAEDFITKITAHPDKDFVLSSDIAFSSAFTPIESFTGTLNGNGHTIRGLYTGGAQPLNAALFSEASGATFENLSLYVDIRQLGIKTDLSAGPDNAIGVLTARLLNSTVRNVNIFSIEGNRDAAPNVSGNALTGVGNMGAIAGIAAGSLIENCNVAIKMESGNGNNPQGGIANVGLIVGKAIGTTVKNSAVGITKTGSVIGGGYDAILSEAFNIGGAVGYAENCHIENITVDPSVRINLSLIAASEAYAESVGGLIGCATDSGIKGAKAGTAITISENDDDTVYIVGGLIGYANGYHAPTGISDSYAIGDITVNMGSTAGKRSYSYYIGGAIGVAEMMTVSTTFANQKITVNAPNFAVETLNIASFIGYGWETFISDCYADGELNLQIASSSSYLSGVAGFCAEAYGVDNADNPTIKYVYSNVKITGASGATVKNLARLVPPPTSTPIVVPDAYFGGEITLAGTLQITDGTYPPFEIPAYSELSKHFAKATDNAASLYLHKIPNAVVTQLQAPSKVYNGTYVTAASLQYTTTGANFDYTSGVSATLSFVNGINVIPNARNAGTYELKAVFTTGRTYQKFFVNENYVIERARLTVIGYALDYAGNVKEYDGKSEVKWRREGASVLLAGIVIGDDVGYDSSGILVQTADKNVGENKEARIVSGFILTGATSGNYMFDGLLGYLTVVPKTLNVTGLSNDAKTYDGTELPSFIYPGYYSGLFLSGSIAGDIVSLDASASDIFYFSRVISNADIDIAGDAAEELYGRIYGSGSDKRAYVRRKNVGTNIPIAFEFVLMGDDAKNYSLIPINTGVLSGNIVPRPLKIEGFSVAPKIYDGLISTPINDTNVILLDVALDVPILDIIPNDDIAYLQYSSRGQYNSKNIEGNNFEVRVSAAQLTGADTLNYSLSGENTAAQDWYVTLRDGDAGAILKRPVVWGNIYVADKIYDGTYSVTVEINSGSLFLYYDGINTSNLGMPTGLCSGDAVTLTRPAGGAAYEYFDGIEAGVHRVYFVGYTITGLDSLNYDFRGVLSVNKTISPRRIIIAQGNITANAKAYDGTTAAEIRFAYGGLTEPTFEDFVYDAVKQSLTSYDTDPAVRAVIRSKLAEYGVYFDSTDFTRGVVLVTTGASAVFVDSLPNPAAEVYVSGLQISGIRAQNYYIDSNYMIYSSILEGFTTIEKGAFSPEECGIIVNEAQPNNARANGLNGTYIVKEPLVITANDGFFVRRAESAAWSTSVTFDDEIADAIAVLQFKDNKTGEISTNFYIVYTLDMTAPTGILRIQGEEFAEFSARPIFNYYYPAFTRVEIVGIDNSASPMIEFIAVGASLTEQELLDGETAEGVPLKFTFGNAIYPAAGRLIVYAKVTDVAGNITLVSSPGMTFFESGEAETAKVNYEKGQKETVKIRVQAKGNTIDKITFMGGLKTLSAQSYSIETDEKGDYITISGALLDSLSGDNTFVVHYTPEGAQSGNFHGVPPQPTTFLISIEGKGDDNIIIKYAMLGVAALVALFCVFGAIHFLSVRRQFKKTITETAENAGYSLDIYPDKR